jgi:hypothetical protein
MIIFVTRGWIDAIENPTRKKKYNKIEDRTHIFKAVTLWFNRLRHPSIMQHINVVFVTRSEKCIKNGMYVEVIN